MALQAVDKEQRWLRSQGSVIPGMAAETVVVEAEAERQFPYL